MLIATSDANLSDPYMGEPMTYDPLAQTISFMPRGAGDQSKTGVGTVYLGFVEKSGVAKP